MTNNDEFMVVPVRWIDLYWVERNAKYMEENPGANTEDLAQTEHDGELFFNDEVIEYVCEDCGREHKSGYRDIDSGVSYCLRCLAEVEANNSAKIVKRSV